MKRVLIALGLLLIISGCFSVNRSSIFIPQCEADAPSALQLQVPSARIDATLFAMEERGWQKVSRQRYDTVNGECAIGTAEPILFDYAGREAEEAVYEERSQAAKNMMIGVVWLAIPAGLLHHALKRPIAIPAGSMFGASVGFALGFVHITVMLVTNLVCVVIIAYAVLHGSKQKKGVQ